jgi:predicted DNA-binding transcriptional regulator YafY
LSSTYSSYLGTLLTVNDSLDLVVEEARAHRTVVIEAAEKDGSVETREIEPYSIRPGQEEDRLIYYCLKRNGTRSVLLANLLTAEPTGRTFEPRYDVEL